MSARVLQFGETTFDATDFEIRAIMVEVRARGWAGFRIDGDDVAKTGRVIVHRISARDAGGVSPAGIVGPTDG